MGPPCNRVPAAKTGPPGPRIGSVGSPEWIPILARSAFHAMMSYPAALDSLTASDGDPRTPSLEISLTGQLPDVERV